MAWCRGCPAVASGAHGDFYDVDPAIKSGFYGAPAVCVVFAQKNFLYSVPDAFCCAENMVLMAADLGISSCIIARGEETFDSGMGTALLMNGACLTTISHDALYCWGMWTDITTLKADAIVNAANSGMRGCFHALHSCIDNIIHSKSGIQLRLYCDELMNRQGHEEPTGQAKITPAFNLPSRYVLHTVGPIIGGRVTRQDRELLASCYRSCLGLAAENRLESVVFCCISTCPFNHSGRKHLKF